MPTSDPTLACDPTLTRDPTLTSPSVALQESTLHIPARCFFPIE
jgi:hypothetical protein